MKKRFSCFFVFSVIASLAFTTVSSLSIANTYKKAIQTYEELSARESLVEQYVELAQEIPVSYVSDRAVQESTLMDTAIMATIPTQMSDLDTAYDLSDTCDDAIAARIEEYEKEKAEREAIQARTSDPSVASQMASRPGMIGRLTIPSLGINVALYASNSQSVVDAADSAACFGFGSATVIGDHQDQGFSAIRSSYVGDQSTAIVNGYSIKVSNNPFNSNDAIKLLGSEKDVYANSKAFDESCGLTIAYEVEPGVEYDTEKLHTILSSAKQFDGDVTVTLFGTPISENWDDSFAFNQDVAEFDNEESCIYLSRYEGSLTGAGLDDTVSLGDGLEAKSADIKDDETGLSPYFITSEDYTFKFLATSDEVLISMFSANS